MEILFYNSVASFGFEETNGGIQYKKIKVV